MGVMEYTSDKINNEVDEAEIKPSLCMIWNKLLELEEHLMEIKIEILKKPLK